MELCFKCKNIKLYTKKFGKIEVLLDRKNKIGNGYLVETVVGRKTISGYIDLDYNEVIELDERKLVKEFHTDNYQDICLKYKVKGEKVLECYHVTMKDKTARIAFLVGPYSDFKYNIINTSDDNYWLLQTIGPEKEYAVYDIKQRRPITSFFDMVEFVDPKDSIYHTIFFQKTIKSDIVDCETDQSDLIIHTTLCGFLASDGSFSSGILDQEEEITYPTFNMGDNTFSPEYNNFINMLHKAYLEEYAAKSDRINDYISFLADNPNVYNNSCKRKAKIISFNERKCSNEKR